jgi:ubiquitin carboxyl-terminal hydrolase L3
MGKKWLPLESNPAVLNDFAGRIGFTDSNYRFCDVFGLDPELLQMVPQPVLALLLLFPLTPEAEAAKVAQEEEAAKAGGRAPGPHGLYFMRQTIGNACGTIGLLHALGNARGDVQLEPGSWLEEFYSRTEAMSPAERGSFLEHPPSDAPSLDDAHDAAANEGQTKPPEPDEVVALHFVALVEREGRLWELDGRKSGPVPHGPTSRDTLLQDSVAVVKKFMETAGGDINFNLIALAPPSPYD